MDKLGLTNWTLNLREDGAECEAQEAYALCQPRPDALSLRVIAGQAICADNLSPAENEVVACHEAIHAVMGQYRALVGRVVEAYVRDGRAASLLMDELYALENEAVDSIARAMVGGD
jgi:hypothetical protein